MLRDPRTPTRPLGRAKVCQEIAITLDTAAGATCKLNQLGRRPREHSRSNHAATCRDTCMLQPSPSRSMLCEQVLILHTCRLPAHLFVPLISQPKASAAYVSYCRASYHPHNLSSTASIITNWQYMGHTRGQLAQRACSQVSGALQSDGGSVIVKTSVC